MRGRLRKYVRVCFVSQSFGRHDEGDNNAVNDILFFMTKEMVMMVTRKRKRWRNVVLLFVKIKKV